MDNNRQGGRAVKATSNGQPDQLRAGSNPAPAGYRLLDTPPECCGTCKFKDLPLIWPDEVYACMAVEVRRVKTHGVCELWVQDDD